MRPAVVVLALFAAACAPRLDAELFEVDPIAVQRLEAGRALSLRGRGFPAGQEASVRFLGEMLVPGRGPARVSVPARAEALSAESLAVQVDAELIERLGGRGTFRGALVVEHAPPEGLGVVSGREGEVVLDVVPPGHRFEPGQGVLADRLGLIVGERGVLGDAEEPGLPIVEVVPGSLAARAGLTTEHRVVAVDGLRALAPSELVGSLDAESVGLEITRAGEPGSLPVTIALPSAQASRSDARDDALELAIAFLLAVLVLAAPYPAAWRARGVVEAPRARGVLAVMTAALVAALLAGPLASSSLLPVALVVGSLRALLPVLAERSLRARALELPLGIVGIVALAAALVPAMISAGASGTDSLREASGALPTSWLLLRAPGSLLGMLALGLAVTLTAEQLALPSDVRARALARCDDLALGVTSALASVVLLGAGSGAGQAAPLVAALGAALVGGVLVRARAGLAGGDGRSARAIAALVLASVGLATTVLQPRLGTELEARAAEIGALVLLCVAARVVRERPATALRPQHALL